MVEPTTVAGILRDGPVLLYDGECGVCASSVQWVLKHETEHSLRFAALQSEVGQLLRRETAVGDDVDSLVWVEAQDGVVSASVYSSAVVQTIGYVGGAWAALGRLLRIVPRPLRNLGYKLFAAHRASFAPTQCLIPTQEERARFVQSAG